MDLSEEMLTVADEKIAEQGLSNVRFFMGDMSNFQIGEEFDAVVSCCDSVNYLPDKDAVQNFIYCSQDALKSGGLLLFDINTPVKFKEVIKDNTYVYDLDNVYCVWENSPRPAFPAPRLRAGKYSDQQSFGPRPQSAPESDRPDNLEGSWSCCRRSLSENPIPVFWYLLSPFTFPPLCSFDVLVSHNVVAVCHNGCYQLTDGLSADITTNGRYAKAWNRVDDQIIMYKADDIEGNETIREVNASKILDCFGVDHVSYELACFDGHRVSMCECMTNEDRSIVPYRHFIAACKRKGIDDVDDIINEVKKLMPQVTTP